MDDDSLDLQSLPAGLLLAEIDAQQDDLLAKLDALNSRLELILRECTPPKKEKVPVDFAEIRRAA